MLRIRMQRFFNKLISNVRPIEVAGVDMGNTKPNNLAQDRECSVLVCWRPEYMRTSQLHRTVPHARKDQIIGESKRPSRDSPARARILSKASSSVSICDSSADAGKLTRAMQPSVPQAVHREP